MDREDKDSIQYDYIDKLLQKIYGYTDEQILKDFEEAEKDDGSYPDFPEYPDEFDRIWEDIQAERAERMKSEPEEEAATVVEPPRKVRKIRWKRVAITGIAACLVTLSVCFVAVGKKSYFYREGRGIKNSVVINNDSNLCAVNGEEEAYNVIENELGIKPLKLGYMPSDMKFLKMTAGNGHAEVEFMLDKQSIFLTMAKNDTEASKSRISDGEEDIEIENKWIGKELSIKKEYLSAGTYFEAQLFDNGAFYSLSGIVEEKEFLKMVERLIY